MGIDYTLYCLDSREQIGFPRTSRGGRWRDAFYLYEMGLDITPHDWRLDGAVVLTPEVFDDGRLNADEAEEQDDVRLDRWTDEEAWCRQWWDEGMHVVMIREQTLAEDYLIYGKRLT